MIGAGLAGLHCAYRLAEAGARVDVYEATSRVGGRTMSVRDHFPDGQVAELGGELINTDHVTLRALVGELGLELDDLHAATPAGAIEEIFRFDGRTISERELVELFVPTAAKIAAEVKAAAASADRQTELDRTSLAAWLDASGAEPLLRDILCTSYAAEFGLEAEEQTVFNLFELIDWEKPDPFRLLGDSDERFHVRGGNDRVAGELARRLGDRVHTSMPLVSIAKRSSSYLLTFGKGASMTERAVERVVLALPFSTLRAVDLSRAGLSDDKRGIIEQLGYGTNAKLMAGFRERIWLTRHNASGAAVTDEGPQMTWDTTRAQPGAAGILTVFVGGKLGVAMGRGSNAERMQEALAPIDRLFPGAGAACQPELALRRAWSDIEFARGSYACYLPGQYEMVERIGQRDGNLHFCGEHTSIDFQGYMEGACESGLRAAREILG